MSLESEIAALTAATNQLTALVLGEVRPGGQSGHKRPILTTNLNLYVNQTSGNDINPGTEALPFASLDRAFTEARKYSFDYLPELQDWGTVMINLAPGQYQHLEQGYFFAENCPAQSGVVAVGIIGTGTQPSDVSFSYASLNACNLYLENVSFAERVQLSNCPYVYMNNCQAPHILVNGGMGYLTGVTLTEPAGMDYGIMASSEARLTMEWLTTAEEFGYTDAVIVALDGSRVTCSNTGGTATGKQYRLERLSALSIHQGVQLLGDTPGSADASSHFLEIA